MIRFVGATDRGGAVLLGVPYDRTQSYRPGASHGPRAVREASWSLETYSPTLDADLEDVGLLDAGDLEVTEAEPAAMVEAVSRAVAEILPTGIPVLLGGDHTASVGAVQAAARRFPDLRVVVLDAHLDLRAEYEGQRWSHACTVRRIMEAVGDGRVVQMGARSGTREEWEFARRHCRWTTGVLAMPETVRAELNSCPVYLSVDLDELDPAFAPGVGNPEPGGPGFADLLEAIYALRGLPLVGMDLMETAPPLDPSGATAVAAAKLLREMVLCLCSSGPRR